MYKTKLLKFIHYFTFILGLINILLLLYFIFFNPFDVKLVWILVLPIAVFIYDLFSYYKLYKDNVPVITLVIPYILHIGLTYLFYKQISWKCFLILICSSIVYMLYKIFKVSLYPLQKEEPKNGK